MANNIPSSLYHYTTSEVVTLLFNTILNHEYTELQNPVLTFHASEAHYMNDRDENGLIVNNLYFQSKELIQSFEKIKTKLNRIFILSLGKSRDSLPMWFIYGGNGSGVALRFDFNTLKRTFHFIPVNKLDTQDLKANELIVECDYKTKTEIEKRAKEFRENYKSTLQNETDNSCLIDKLNNIQIKTVALKYKHFEYESEYRLLKQTNEILYKNGKYGITMYQTIDIPLNALKEIIIGPMCHQDITMEALKNLSDKVYEKFNQKINISKSLINIK